MTYRGHGVLHTLIRCRFSPTHSTGQQFIYSGCSTGKVVGKDCVSTGASRRAGRFLWPSSCNPTSDHLETPRGDYKWDLIWLGVEEAYPEK